MDAETARTFLLTLPHVAETRQWGDNLLFWLGEKSIGGKMFCVIDLDRADLPSRTDKKQAVVSFLVGPERFHELLERDGLFPAPYFARIYWVAAERWSALRNNEWHEEFRNAHALTLARLPPKAKRALGLLPPATSKKSSPKKAAAKPRIKRPSGI